MSGYGPFVAAALIMAALVAGLLLMPRIMAALSGAGPIAGLLVALAFVAALFGVLWLRARHQNRRT